MERRIGRLGRPRVDVGVGLLPSDRAAMPASPRVVGRLVAEADAPLRPGSAGVLARLVVGSLACCGIVTWPLAAVELVASFLMALALAHGAIAVANEARERWLRRTTPMPKDGAEAPWSRRRTAVRRHVAPSARARATVARRRDANPSL
jgi:hypothetical protein